MEAGLGLTGWDRWSPEKASASAPSRPNYQGGSEETEVCGNSSNRSPALSCPPGARDTRRRESSASPAWGTETTDLVSRDRLDLDLLVLSSDGDSDLLSDTGIRKIDSWSDWAGLGIT